MSDSGRQIGDCRHGKQPRWCVECLQDRVDFLEKDCPKRILAAIRIELDCCITTVEREFLADEDIAADLAAHGEAKEDIAYNMAIRHAADSLKKRRR